MSVCEPASDTRARPMICRKSSSATVAWCASASGADEVDRWFSSTVCWTLPLVPPSHAGGVTRALSQAQVHLWAGMGHHPQRGRPHDLAALVEAACHSQHLPRFDEQRTTSVSDATGHNSNLQMLKRVA